MSPKQQLASALYSFFFFCHSVLTLHIHNQTKTKNKKKKPSNIKTLYEVSYFVWFCLFLISAELAVLFIPRDMPKLLSAGLNQNEDTVCALIVNFTFPVLLVRHSNSLSCNFLHFSTPSKRLTPSAQHIFL